MKLRRQQRGLTFFGLLIVGVFMDMTPAVLIFTPIFLPIVTELGMDPVHFGIIITVNIIHPGVTRTEHIEEWFAEMAADSSLHEALFNSLTVAVAASILSTCLGLFAARATTGFRFPGKGAITGLIMLPLVLPEMIVAMSMLVYPCCLHSAATSCTRLRRPVSAKVR